MSAEKFANLLTEGIYKIRFEEAKNIRVIQDELGYALGKQGGASIEYWRKGYIPARLSDIEKLAREIVKRAHLERAWLEKFLRNANHPAPEKLCDELFSPISSTETQQEQSTVPKLHLATIPIDTTPDEEPTEVERSVFVAREDELVQLNRYLTDMLTEQQGLVVFVTGEAGSGKTALVEEFAWRALEAHASLVVAGGNCNAYTGVGDPYLPFREILGLLTDDRETRWAAKALIRKHAHRLRNSLPYMVQVLVNAGPDLVDTFIPGSALITRAETVALSDTHWLAQLKVLVARKATVPGPTNLEQRNLFEQYTKVLRSLARRGPIVLILDDLQWADKGSINLLFHLAKRLENSPILIVSVYRPADVALGRDGKRHPLEPIVNELQRHFGPIRVNLKQTRSRC
ncbi:MAG: ATP-binding protein [Chloroflexi bacterium]|nr:ATP-binding protein [Chloroflexota bacterium]